MSLCRRQRSHLLKCNNNESKTHYRSTKLHHPSSQAQTLASLRYVSSVCQLLQMFILSYDVLSLGDDSLIHKERCFPSQTIYHHFTKLMHTLQPGSSEGKFAVTLVTSSAEEGLLLSSKNFPSYLSRHQNFRESMF